MVCLCQMCCDALNMQLNMQIIICKWKANEGVLIHPVKKDGGGWVKSLLSLRLQHCYKFWKPQNLPKLFNWYEFKTSLVLCFMIIWCFSTIGESIKIGVCLLYILVLSFNCSVLQKKHADYKQQMFENSCPRMFWILIS